jgi:hypothetical protein
MSSASAYNIDRLENRANERIIFRGYAKDVASFCNEVGGAAYAGEYDASLIGRKFVHFKGGH